MANAFAYDARLDVSRPAVRRIGLGDLWAVLAAGWADFMAIPTQLVFLGLIYPAVGLVAARAAAGGGVLPLLFPMIAGLALLGPVLAVGTYEISRQREAGLNPTWRSAFDVLRAPGLPGVVGLGVLLLAVFVVWIGVARAIYVGTVGAMAPASVGDLLQAVQDSPRGWALVVFGNLVGAGFAAVVLAVSAVSFPMLLDRAVTPTAAIGTSMRVVRANPAVMVAWGVLVAVILALGSLPLFVGLAVAMPVLGHATWHLYRRTVA